MLDAERNAAHSRPDVRANSFKDRRPFRIIFDNLDSAHIGLLTHRTRTKTHRSRLSAPSMSESGRKRNGVASSVWPRRGRNSPSMRCVTIRADASTAYVPKYA